MVCRRQKLRAVGAEPSLAGLQAAAHAPRAEHHEGYGEYLAHVEGHGRLERYLYVLGELYEEAEREDERQAQPEEVARAHALRMLAVQPPPHEEEEEVGYGLVELPGVARLRCHLGPCLHEVEAPRQVGDASEYLGVHEVAKAYEARRHGRGYGYVVEHLPEAQARLAAVEPQGEHETERAAVRGEAAVARELPSAALKKLYGHEYLHDVLPRREEEVGLVEEAVAQSRTHDDAHEAVYEERVEELVLYLLLTVELPYYEICQQQSREPAQGVPVQGEVSDAESRVAGIPDDVQWIHDVCGVWFWLWSWPRPQRHLMTPASSR